MSDFTFNCPHCEQPFEAPEEMLGQTIECPSCNGVLELPKPDPGPEPELPPPAEPETKDCPYCGERILAKAKKCKHCGEILDSSLMKQRQAQSRPSHPPSPQPPRSQPPQVKTVVKPRGEGCCLQTLNVGCVIIFIVIGLIALLVYVRFSASG